MFSLSVTNPSDIDLLAKQLMAGDEGDISFGCSHCAYWTEEYRRQAKHMIEQMDYERSLESKEDK